MTRNEPRIPAMTLRLLAAVLLATTAMSGVAHAETATPPTTTDQATPVKKPKKAAATVEPKPAEPTTAAQPADQAKAAPKGDARGLSGMTASPTDFGTVFAKGNGEGTSAGGSTGKELGGGYMIEEEVPKARSTVTRDAIDKLSPAANPYQMINLLPGVNQTSTSASGLNGGDITIRGMESSQIGFTIEGAPVNDSGSYALYPQEYVDSENTEQVSLAQGTPDLDSPHVGATGGVINLYMRDPSKTAGGYFSSSFGSHNQWRQFLRAESGQIGNFRGYVSYSYNYGNHWSGVGTDNRTHVDTKMVWDLDAGNHIRASIIYNRALNNFYANPTLAQFNTPGYLPNYNASLTGNASTDTNWYGYKANPFENAIISLPSDFHITDNLTYDVIPYFWYGFGSGGGVATMTEGKATYYGNSAVNGVDWNASGKVVSGTAVNYFNPSITRTYRPGIINKLTYQIDDHKIVGGYWFESAFHKQTGPFQALDSSGQVQNYFMTDSDGYKIAGGPNDGRTLMKRDQTTRTVTNMFFLGDSWSIAGDTLKLDYGVKQVFVNRDLTNSLPGATPDVQANDAATLPQAGITWKLNQQHQVFASVGTAFRTTPNYALADSINTGTGVYSPAGKQDPERSVTVEIGHRYQGELFASSLSVFGTHFENRQVSTSVLDQFGNSVSSYTNAGTVNSIGLEAEIGTRPLLGGLRPYASLALLKTRMEDDLPTTSTSNGKARPDWYATAGKELPKAPNIMAALGLDWDDGHYLANISAKYIGPQYATFMNDERLDGYARLDAGIGYRFDDLALGEKASVKRPEIRLNLTNLFDSRQLTGVYSTKTNAQSTTTVLGSKIAGSSPAYYMGEGFSAMVTFKAAF